MHNFETLAADLAPFFQRSGDSGDTGDSSWPDVTNVTDLTDLTDWINWTRICLLLANWLYCVAAGLGLRSPATIPATVSANLLRLLHL